MKTISKLEFASVAFITAMAFAGCNNDDTIDNDSSSDSNGDSDGSTGGSGSGSGGSANLGGGGAGGEGGASSTALAQLQDDPDFAYFAAAIARADLESEFEAKGITVFAPNNDAFRAFLDDWRVESIDDLTPGQLAPIVRYHVVSAQLSVDALIDFAPGSDKKASLGGTFDVSAAGDTVSVDHATIVAGDTATKNGIVHEIDEVLMPSITDIVSTDGRFTGLYGLVTDADGGSGSPSISSTLDASSSLSNWLFFAPNNAAVGAITAPENQALTNVLLYHAVAQLTVTTYDEALLLTDQSIGTAFDGHSVVVDGGSEVTVTDEDADSSVATVVEGDIHAENGIIHVIDDVLLPD